MTRTNNRALANWPNNAVSVLDFGAVGDGVTDDGPGIKAAFNLVVASGGTLVFPPGTYNSSESFINSIDKPVAIEGYGGAIINFIGSTKSYGISLNWDSPIDSVSVTGLTLKGNDLITWGIRLGSTTDVRSGNVSVRDCIISDLKLHSDSGSSQTTSVCGIWVDSTNITTISGNSVTNLTRERTGFCAGISSVNSNQPLIDNNYIENVSFGLDPAKIDADGIKLFHLRSDTGFYSRQAGTISNNTIIDATGRFIKLQTGGNVDVCNNTCKIVSAVELIRNFRAFDSQSGRADIYDNVVHFGRDWTAGESLAVFGPQMPGAANVEYDHEVFCQNFHNNTITFEKDIAYGILPGEIEDIGTKFHYVLEFNNNKFLSLSPPGVDYDVAYSKVSKFIRCDARDWPSFADMESSVTWKIVDNIVGCYYWLDMPSNSPVDYADKWFFHWHNNTKIPSLGPSTILINRDSVFTSTMAVSDSAADVYCSFDFQKLLPGCSFYVGGGTNVVPINGPPSSVYKSVITTQKGIQVWDSNKFFVTGDMAVNWSDNLIPETFLAVGTTDLLPEEQVSTADLPVEEQDNL